MSLKKALFQIKASFFLLFLSPFTLALAPASDTLYIKTPLSKKLEVIFSEDFKEEDFLIQSRSLRIFQEYGRQFPVEFYRKNSIILFSAKRRQTPLAITHTLPLPLIQIYPSPFQIIDQVSTNNWLTDSLIHEMAHIYQLSDRTRFSHLLSFIIPPYLWPVYPNIYLHHLILEGHAVLLESIYGTGGRLFSGWERALAFSQLKNGLPFKRAINSYDDPFSKSEKFVHGGYFFSYLIEKFPLSQLNEIFSINGQNLLWPLGLYTVNRSFKKALGQDFDSLFNEYKELYREAALKQTSSPDPPLVTSQFAVPINSNETHLFFLVSNGKRPPRLVVLNKETEELVFKTVDMPLGKVFFIKGRYYSAGYGRTDTLSVKMSLFRDGFIPLKKYNSSYVMDIQENTTLSFDALGGLDQLHLYLNKELLDGARSTAVKDTQGRAWYFKQQGENRMLYRNKTPLWTYKGYYGFPVEASESEVYFLAPTPYGSGLFVYSEQGVSRLSPSDTIVSARQINKEKFLVCEVNNNHFEYKIISVKPFSDQPVLYEYSFQKRDLMKDQDALLSDTNTRLKENTATLNESEGHITEENDSLSSKQPLQNNESNNQIPSNTTENTNSSDITQEQLAPKEHEWKRKSSYYHSIFNLRFQEMALGWDFRDIFQTRGFHPEKWPFHYRLSFTDPLEHSFLSTQGRLSPQSRYFLTLYEYRRYRPVWHFSYQKGGQLKKTDSINSHYFQTGLRYPLMRRENWSFSVSVNGAVKTIRKNQETLHPFIGHELKLNFNFNKRYPFALYAYRKWQFSFHYNNEYDMNKSTFHPSYGLQWSAENELAKSFYMFNEGKWWKNKRNTDILSSILLPGKPSPWSLHSLAGEEKEIQGMTNALFVSIHFKKVINQSIYPVYFPLALRRWAPFIGISSLFSWKDKDTHSHYANPSRRQQASTLRDPDDKTTWFIHEFLYTFIGGEMELSANHKALAHAGISGGLLWKSPKNTQPLPSFQWGIYLKARF